MAFTESLNLAELLADAPPRQIAMLTERVLSGKTARFAPPSGPFVSVYKGTMFVDGTCAYAREGSAPQDPYPA